MDFKKELKTDDKIVGVLSDKTMIVKNGILSDRHLKLV